MTTSISTPPHDPGVAARTITVIGAGNVGGHLIAAFQRAGHNVRLAARNASSTSVSAAVERFGVGVVPIAAAGDDSDLVVLAVPFDAVVESVTAIGDVSSTILVDATNPVGGTLPDTAMTVVDLIAAARPEATIVKAFNTIGAEALIAPSIDGRALFLPIAGDAAATEAVRAVAAGLGFDAVVIGDRNAARLLEQHAALWIHLALRTGLGRDFGFARLHRSGASE